MRKNIVSLVYLFITVSLFFADSTILDLQNKLHAIADNEAQSVVFISTEKKIKRPQMGFDFFEYFFNSPNRERGNPRNEETFKQSALGSGVIYSKKANDYYIITNNHVVDGADKIKITIDGRKQYDATIVGGDFAVDIAVLKITTKDSLRTAKMGEAQRVRVADMVVAIGNPFGLSHSVTFGIISALGRGDLDASKPGFTNFIQTDAAINPGNSGGPLLNLNGEVIGINTMIYSQSGGNIGIGFAIPIDIALNITEQLIQTGKIEHGWIGITFQEMDKDKLDKLGYKDVNSGMLVMQVVPNGPADKAGIKSGDILTKINNKELLRSNDLTVLVGNSRPGTKLAVTFMRDKSTLMKYITIEKRDDGSVTQAAKGSADSTGTASDKYGFVVTESNKGLVVNEIIRGSRASQAGLQVNDVILKINNQLVRKIKDIEKAVGDDETAYFFIERNGSSLIIMM